MKLHPAVGGSKIGTLDVAVSSTLRSPRLTHGNRAERIRNLLLGLAIAMFGLLFALLLTSDPATLPRFSLPAELAALAMHEPLPGLSWLQVVGASSGAAATWLLARRFRRSMARRRFVAPAPEDLAAQTALVAAWTHKASRLTDRPELDDDLVIAPPLAPVPPPLSPVPGYELADPAAAADFIAWGRQAARSGDQLVAYRLLSQAVRLDPGSADAWLWLAGTCDQREESIHCLERVLAINPGNAWALRGLAELRTE